MAKANRYRFRAHPLIAVLIVACTFIESLQVGGTRPDTSHTTPDSRDGFGTKPERRQAIRHAGKLNSVHAHSSTDDEDSDVHSTDATTSGGENDNAFNHTPKTGADLPSNTNTASPSYTDSKYLHDRLKTPTATENKTDVPNPTRKDQTSNKERNEIENDDEFFKPPNNKNSSLNLDPSDVNTSISQTTIDIKPSSDPAHTISKSYPPLEPLPSRDEDKENTDQSPGGEYHLPNLLLSTESQHGHSKDTKTSIIAEDTQLGKTPEIVSDVSDNLPFSSSTSQTVDKVFTDHSSTSTPAPSTMDKVSLKDIIKFPTLSLNQSTKSLPRTKQHQRQHGHSSTPALTTKPHKNTAQTWPQSTSRTAGLDSKHTNPPHVPTRNQIHFKHTIPPHVPTRNQIQSRQTSGCQQRGQTTISPGNPKNTPQALGQATSATNHHLNTSSNTPLLAITLTNEGHSVRVKWNLSITDQNYVQGFVVSYKMEGRENYDSSRLGKQVRTFILHSLHEDKEYSICVQAVGPEDEYLEDICLGWSKSSMRIVVGIIAGATFLLPCFLIVVWVIFKDFQMRRNGQIITEAIHTKKCDHSSVVQRPKDFCEGKFKKFDNLHQGLSAQDKHKAMGDAAKICRGSGIANKAFQMDTSFHDVTQISCHTSS